MAVTTLETPNRTIYDPFPPTAYQTGFDSPWISAHLPIVYKFLSDRYPTNNLDSPVSISSHADNGAGLVEFTTGAAHGWNKYDYVTISSSSIAAYNGTFEIIEVGSTTTFTINVAYDASSLGSPTGLEYYNNYHLKIEFYQGLDSGHTYYNEDPESLKATIRILIDSNNEGFLDLSRLCQAYVNANNSNAIPSWPNYLNGWTQVRIKVYEAYDQSDGTEVTVTENDQGYESYIYLINSKKLFRNSFGGNMGDYVVNGSVSGTKFLTPRSNALYFPDHYFDLAVGVNVAGTYILNIKQLDQAGAEAYPEISEEFIFSDIGVFRLRLDDLGINSGAKCLDILLSSQDFSDDWTAKTDVPQGTIVGAIAMIDTNKIVAISGYSSGEYVYYSDNGGTTWTEKLNTTDFPNSGGMHKNLAFNGGIREGNTIDLLVAAAGNSTDAAQYSTDGGVTWTACGSAHGFTAYGAFIGYDTLSRRRRLILCGDGGNIWYSDNYGTSWTDISLAVGTSVRSVFFIDKNTGWACGAGGIMYKTTNGGTSWSAQTSNASNTLNRVHFFTSLKGIAVGLSGWYTKTTDGGTNWTAAQYTGNPYLYDLYFTDESNGWLVGLKLLYTDDFAATFTEQTITGTDLYAIDGNGAQVFAGGSDTPSGNSTQIKQLAGVTGQATETKQICIKSDCAEQEIYLTWLNNLGGWDYHLFSAEKDFITNIEESKRGERSIYDGWPNRFINGETLTEWLMIRGRDGIIVRSQFLTQEQADEVARIRNSIHVQWMIDGMDDKKTVLVDKASFTRYTEANKLEVIEFQILMTDETPIQSN